MNCNKPKIQHFLLGTIFITIGSKFGSNDLTSCRKYYIYVWEFAYIYTGQIYIIGNECCNLVRDARDRDETQMNLLWNKY